MFRFISAGIVLTAGIALQLGCSSKTSEQKKQPDTTAKGESPKVVNTAPAPARISFRLDDSKGELYVARPATALGMEIRSFVAVKAVEMWTSIELGLVDGSKKTIDEITLTSKYYLEQHDPKGIDFVELDAEGKRSLVVGPLVSMHLRTNVDLRKPPLVEGKTVLVLNMSGETIQVLPAELSQLKVHTIDGPGARTGWSLLEAISSRIPIAKIASLEAHAKGEVKRFSGDVLGNESLQLLIRHNKRGEIRLKVFQDGKETEDGLRSLERVVIVPR